MGERGVPTPNHFNEASSTRSIRQVFGCPGLQYPDSTPRISPRILINFSALNPSPHHLTTSTSTATSPVPRDIPATLQHLLRPYTTNIRSTYRKITPRCPSCTHVQQPHHLLATFNVATTSIPVLRPRRAKIRMSKLHSSKAGSLNRKPSGRSSNSRSGSAMLHGHSASGPPAATPSSTDAPSASLILASISGGMCRSPTRILDTSGF